MSPEPARRYGLCYGRRQWPVILPSPPGGLGAHAGLSPSTSHSISTECPLFGAQWYTKERTYVRRGLLPTPPQSANSFKPRTVTSLSLDLGEPATGLKQSSCSEQVYGENGNEERKNPHMKPLGT